MSVNNDLYDRSIGHAANARQFEETIRIQNQRITSRHRTSLNRALTDADFSTGAGRSAANGIVKTETRKFIRELSDNTANNMRDYTTAAVDFQTNNLTREVGKIIKVKKPKTQRILDDLVGFNIYEDGKDKSTGMKAQFNRIGSGQLVRVQSAISRGLSEGLTNEEIVRNILKKTKLTEHQANTLVRTSITNAQSKAFISSMETNKDVIKGYRFTATLDARTSKICAHHDGIVYDLDDKQWFPPLHWNCRSTIVPVVKSFDELLEEKPARVKIGVLNKLKPEEIKRFRGYPPTRETFGNWLRRQNYETQLRYLDTPEKVKLFQNGQIPYMNFVNARGKTMSISALRRFDNAHTVNFPTKQHVLCNTQRVQLQVNAAKPGDIMRSRAVQNELRALHIGDASEFKNALAVMNYRGVKLKTKFANRNKLNNQYDESNFLSDPLTGQRKSPLEYDPNPSILEQRLDLVRNSKSLTKQQREFIEDYIGTLKDKVGTNQQSAITDQLRVVFERYQKDGKPWDNLTAVLRAESKFAVQNVSGVLETQFNAKSKIFGAFGKSADPAQISILGAWRKFDDISSDLRKNEQFIDRWQATKGRQLARSFYFTGRAPWRTYLFGPQKDNIFDVKGNILKWMQQKYNNNAFVRVIKRHGRIGEIFELIKTAPERISRWSAELKVKIRTFPSTLINDFLREVNESLRSVVDFEISLASAQQSFIKTFLEPKSVEKNVDNFASYIHIAATSGTNDYDQLAINIGKKIRRDYAASPTLKPGLKDHYEDGARVLKYLEDNNIIRVNFRGTSEKGIVDLDTGRTLKGSIKDTIVREVEFINEDVLALHRAHREVYVGRRLGIVNDRDRLHVRVGKQNYYDSRGNDTGISLVTKKAGANFLSEEVIDRDFANMLNYAMSVEWKVDNNFSGFFDDLAHFRDPRGNVAKYDDLNGFRKIILQRGEQGYGFLQTVKWHRERGKSFRNYYQIDGRGRVYGQGYLTPTSGELARPFLETAVAKNYTREAFEELKIQTGAVVGDGTEVLTQAGRKAVWERNLKDLIEIGDIADGINPKTGRPYGQPAQRIRDFLEHSSGLTQHDPKELPRITRMAVEWSRLNRHMNDGLRNKYVSDRALRMKSISDEAMERQALTYRTTMTIENDASSSGAQIIGLSTRDRKISELSNVVATDSKQRLYDIIAQRTAGDKRFQAINRLGNDINWEDLAKGAKMQNMVLFYGAGEATQISNLRNKFAAQILKKDDDAVLVFAKNNQIPNDFKLDGRIAPKYEGRVFTLEGIEADLEQRIFNARAAGLDNTVEQLIQFKKDVIASIVDDAPVGSKLLSATRDGHGDAEDLIRKLYSNRVNIVGPKEFEKVSSIMSEYLSELAPVTKEFINFWKETAKGYTVRSGSTRIPWVTFDNKELTQIYPPKVQVAIDFIDPTTNKRVRNIIEDTLESATKETLLGKSGIGDAATGLGVNGNHMNDASIVRQAHLWARETKTAHSTIHDAFFTNIVDAVPLKFALRNIYSKAASSRTIERTLDRMRTRGRTAIRNSRKERIKRYENIQKKFSRNSAERNRMLQLERAAARERLTAQDLRSALEKDPGVVERINKFAQRATNPWNVDQLVERFESGKLTFKTIERVAANRSDILLTHMKTDLRSALDLNPTFERALVRRSGISERNLMRRFSAGVLPVSDIIESANLQRKRVDREIRDDLRDFDRWHNERLQSARDRGLIDPKDAITPADIIAPIPDGQDWYGIGP